MYRIKYGYKTDDYRIAILNVSMGLVYTLLSFIHIWTTAKLLFLDFNTMRKMTKEDWRKLNVKRK